MARYSAFLGRKVEVNYRAGDICLPAAGMFVADSGRSIFLETRFDQRGLQRTFRWEVPYAYIIRIEELPSESAGGKAPVLALPAKEPAADVAPESPELKAKGAAAGSGGATATLPFSQRTKLA
jgi:hypothetical protein